jgi:hypothetical protein
VDLFRELCQGFHDQQIFDLIQYGFPLDLESHSFIQNLAVTNHGSATQFPVEVQNYLDTEIKLGSIFGPFSDPPARGASLQSSYDCSEGLFRASYYRRPLISVSPESSSKHFGFKIYLCQNAFPIKITNLNNICQVLSNVGKNVKKILNRPGQSVPTTVFRSF